MAGHGEQRFSESWIHEWMYHPGVSTPLRAPSAAASAATSAATASTDTVRAPANASHVRALSRFGHALSDPTRLGVLLTLREGPAHPSDLADALGVSRQVMSNQLACLRGCGLVSSVPEGRRLRYHLADRHLATALDELLRVALRVDPQCCEGPECTC